MGISACEDIMSEKPDMLRSGCRAIEQTCKPDRSRSEFGGFRLTSLSMNKPEDYELLNHLIIITHSAVSLAYADCLLFASSLVLYFRIHGNSESNRIHVNLCWNLFPFRAQIGRELYLRSMTLPNSGNGLNDVLMSTAPGSTTPCQAKSTFRHSAFSAHASAIIIFL